MTTARLPEPASPWPYATPGIADELFERIPGIPLSPHEVRLVMLSRLRLASHSVFWDIGAGTGTIPVEASRLCPEAQIVAVERDEEVAELIERNCAKFKVTNVRVHRGSAPECLSALAPDPDRVCIESTHALPLILQAVWERLVTGGRVVITTSTLEGLYRVTEVLSERQAIKVEIVQTIFCRLERRGTQQTFAPLDPTFVLSGEKR